MSGVLRGESFGGELCLSEEQIRTFATAIGDLNPIHHDASAARAAGFSTIVASGLHPASIFMALPATHFSQRNPVLGLEFSLKFQKPVFPEVLYRMNWVVLEVEWKQKLAGELVLLQGTLSDPQGQAVVSGTATLLVRPNHA